MKESAVYIIDFRYTFEEQDCSEDVVNKYVELINEHIVPLCKHYIYQCEHSRPIEHEDGPNIHMQGYLRLKVKERPKALARRLNQYLKGIRCTTASNNGCAALRNYAAKEAGRLAGPWTDDSHYNGQDLLPEEKMPKWQQDLGKYLRTKPEERVIHWFYDPQGGRGKSKFRKWAALTLGAVCIDYDTTANIRNNVITAGPQKIYIVNLTRAKPNEIGKGDLYSALESIKDGHVVSGKYKGGQLMMNPPHVVVMANALPLEGMWSADRLKLVKLSDTAEEEADKTARDNHRMIRHVIEEWNQDDLIGDLQAFQAMDVDH